MIPTPTKVTIVTAVIAIVVTQVMCQPVRQEREAKEYKARFCGKQLRIMLSLLCSQEYDEELSPDTADRIKAAVNSTYVFDEIQPVYIPLGYSRRKRGITHECCLSKCSLQLARSYCGKGGYNGPS